MLYNTVDTVNTVNTVLRGVRVKFNFSGNQDLFLEIAQKYEEYIKLGLFKLGDKLPSVRDAASDIGVNPNTVARAYAHLEECGYIRSVPKKGAFVTYSSAADTETSDEQKATIYALRDAGIDKATLIKWIEEVYGE